MLRPPVAPHSPLSFFTLLLLSQNYPSRASYKEAQVEYLGGPINLNYLCNSNSFKLFLQMLGQEQQNGKSMARNRVLLHQLGVTLPCNHSEMPQMMLEDKSAPFHI